jgi:hypothetical protein
MHGYNKIVGIQVRMFYMSGILATNALHIHVHLLFKSGCLQLKDWIKGRLFAVHEYNQKW